MFQSNYDGPAPEYIEAFVYNVSPLIRGIWWGVYGAPKRMKPEDDFVAYILRVATDGERHFYAAYPRQSVRMIRSAFALEPDFRKLQERVAEAPDRLPEAWRAFLKDHALDL